MKFYCPFKDRKIRIWEYKDGKAETYGSLIGSNASIASIDIDHEVKRNLYIFRNILIQNAFKE